MLHRIAVPVEGVHPFMYSLNNAPTLPVVGDYIDPGLRLVPGYENRLFRVRKIWEIGDIKRPDRDQDMNIHLVELIAEHQFRSR